jgi:enoyl-CoA hydratase
MAVLVERQGKVAVVKVSRPEALNALNTETKQNLLRVATELAADDSVNCVVLTGDGDKSFVAGADIVEMSTMSAEQARQFSLLGCRMGAAIEESPQTWIAAVNGFALGGGCELALACDFRVASENAKFGQPEIGCASPASRSARKRRCASASCRRWSPRTSSCRSRSSWRARSRREAASSSGT